MIDAVTTAARGVRLERARELAVAWGHRVAAALLGACIAGGIGFAKGGYYPTSWGWSAFALAWVAAVAFLLRPSRLPRLELAFAAAVAGLVGWTFLSALWSRSVPSTMLDGERVVVYLLAVAAVLATVSRRAVPHLLGGVLAGIVAVCGWGLLERQLPVRLGAAPNVVGGTRLSGAFGYWNSFGLFAAMGLLLALGFASRGSRGASRALGAAAVPVLASAVYLTFGRGVWLALAAGILVAVALDARRAQLLTSATVVLVPAAGVLLWTSRQHALVATGFLARNQIEHAGSRFVALLFLAIIASAALALALVELERRLRPSPTVRRAYGAAWAAAAVVAVAGGIAVSGSPLSAPRTLYHEFMHGKPVHVTNLNARLFSLSGNGRPMLWRVAVASWKRHPLLGTGAGTYEQEWDRYRPRGLKVKNAHNLYLETLSELGPVGLALLACLLALPLAGAIRGRRRPLTSLVAGAYVAFLVHAASDWDWQFTAIGAATLACGAALLVLGRREEPLPLSGRRVALPLAAVAAVGCFAFVGLVGNLALSRSVTAGEHDRWASAAAWARRAQAWAPWSSLALEREAQTKSTAAAARPLYLRAIAKDPNNWELYLELAWASRGAAKQRAIADVRRLNPLSPELNDYLAQLRGSKK